MICKRCNHINNDGAKFCIKCGAPMDENYSQSQSINYNQPNYNDYRYPNNNQTDWAQVIKIIIGTLVVVAVIVLLGSQRRNSYQRQGCNGKAPHYYRHTLSNPFKLADQSGMCLIYHSTRTHKKRILCH